MGENKLKLDFPQRAARLLKLPRIMLLLRAVLPQFSAVICGGVIGRYTDYKQASVRKSGGTAESLRFRPECVLGVVFLWIYRDEFFQNHCKL